MENVLGNSLPNQPGIPIMRGAIDQTMEQHKHQDASMTLVPFQLEQIQDNFIYHMPTTRQPICLTNGTYSMYKPAYMIIIKKDWHSP